MKTDEDSQLNQEMPNIAINIIIVVCVFTLLFSIHMHIYIFWSWNFFLSGFAFIVLGGIEI